MPATISYIFSDSITQRYETLEANIKAKSNSFYDSYLDLLEETVRYILISSELDYDPKWTCGTALRKENVKNFLFNDLHLNEATYNDLIRHIVTANTHKHSSERTVTVEEVVEMLETYFGLINAFGNYINASIFIFDKSKIETMFNESEEIKKGINKIESKIDKFGETLESFEEKFARMEAKMDSLQEENKILKTQQQSKTNNTQANYNVPKSSQQPATYLTAKEQIQHFFNNSKKEYVWLGPYSFFKLEKRNTTIMFIVALSFAFFSTIFTSISLGMYSTFTLLENAWFITMLVFFIRHLKRGKIIDHEKFAKSCRLRFHKGEHNLLYKDSSSKTKVWPKISQVLLVISCICNAIALWIPLETSTSSVGLKVFALILEIGMIVSSILLCLRLFGFEIQYTVARFTNKKYGTNEVVKIYENLNLKQYITEEEFNKRFSKFKEM